jgi:seryl-tRNA(Sec) selenium transferase
MKVGKEEIVGLIVALQRFVERDEAAELARWRAQLAHIESAMRDVPGVRLQRIDPETDPVAVPTTQLRLDEGSLQMNAYEVLNQLQDGTPSVFLNEEHAWRGILSINPIALRDGDERIVAERLREVLTTAQPGRR